MALTIYNDTPLHEAAHTVITYLAGPIFDIEYVTIEATRSKSHDQRSVGGLKGRFKKELDNLTFQDRDICILISLAGLAVDDINHVDGCLTLELYEGAAFLQRLYSFKYKGDVWLLMQHLSQVEFQLKASQRDYIGGCQEFLYEFFTTHWAVLLGLRNELVRAPDHTLEGNQIKSFLDNTPLKKWMDEEWSKVLNSRSAQFR